MEVGECASKLLQLVLESSERKLGDLGAHSCRSGVKVRVRHKQMGYIRTRLYTRQQLSHTGGQGQCCGLDGFSVKISTA